MIPRRSWPGMAATAFLVLATSLWTFWGVAELFWEGWGLPFPQPLFYLAPGATLLALTLLALRFPALGGLVVLAFGAWFTWWWWGLMYRRGADIVWAAIETFPGSAILVIVGVLFLAEARHRRLLRREGIVPAGSWMRRHLRVLVAVGCPLVIAIGVTATQLPVVLSRHDDGIRTSRVIDGNGVRLLWAPAGPGWNWKQPGGWILSWDHLATYGKDVPGVKRLRPVDGRVPHSAAVDLAARGLCGYLSDDGTTLLDQRLGVWRMPTVDEMVRSLSRDGKNAGCAWKGKSGFSPCRVTPDKETPLWAPDQSPIYYWAADEDGPDRAWYVAYNGAVQRQPKNFGNPRHGYRCVRTAPTP